MEGDSVKLLGFWGSPAVLRVKWALAVKGIECQYVEEDLSNKSDMLLKYNPVYKKVPVLVHQGKPLAESLLILEYIDETWKQNPLLPHSPYERAQARFWSKFVDDKCMPTVVAAFSKVGEEQQKAAEEARENLKRLEVGLEGKQFFGGDNIGFADIAIGWLPYWIEIAEEVVAINLIDAESMPKLNSWFHAFIDIPIIKELLPPRHKLLHHTKTFLQA
ncbi:glutathione transferase GST 23-like [Arachis stenosperma]|uniref:glutathione transferase GST 23-like n=1 Tax=Arachis stenosperma TaxID=217475 RepID=UPI0025AC9D81|nr:glutathione transferase GST 23-like [Arachis stenosperma]